MCTHALLISSFDENFNCVVEARTSGQTTRRNFLARARRACHADLSHLLILRRTSMCSSQATFYQEKLKIQPTTSDILSTCLHEKEFFLVLKSMRLPRATRSTAIFFASTTTNRLLFYRSRPPFLAAAFAANHHHPSSYNNKFTRLNMSTKIDCPTIPLRNGMEHPSIGFGYVHTKSKSKTENLVVLGYIMSSTTSRRSSTN
jgi:hypothetical protein